ncbi:MAG: hypothetical protein SF097_09670 [Acidobacteriota bacterium]|nr:hypothetical protein [Acidobacteriota bacterium]
MKLQRLSILSDVSGATESGSASESTVETQTGFSSYLTRYQEFLNRQTSNIQPKSYRTASPIRFMQGMFSFAVFVALFLTILTLVGFGLSSLGVIAQVSPSATSATGKQTELPAAQPRAPAPKRKKITQ